MADFISDEEMAKLEAPDFISDEEMAKSEVSSLESAIRGAAQGATLNFADELAGVLGAGKGAIQSGNLENLAKNYEQSRDESRAAYSAAEQANPLTYGGGQLAGAVATSLIPGLNVAKGASLAKNVAMGAGLGATAGFGAGEGLEGSLKSAGVGATVGGAAGGLSKGLETVSPKLRDYLSQKLGKGAEKLAEKATGATRVQAEKFKEGTGRMLLDTGIVSALDSPETIARKAGAALEKSGSQIGKALEQSGQTVNVQNLAQQLSQRADELASTPQGQPIARQLRSIVDDMMASGQTDVSLPMAEETKRVFGERIKNWMDPMSGAASKEAYSIYKNAVEESMGKASPELLGQFQAAKQSYGMLSPVADAAEKRALQMQQSPLGGLLDTMTATAGGVGVPGSPVAAGATVLGRRVVSSRAASTMATSADRMSKALQNPNLSKYAEVINSAINRGPTAAAAIDFILQQTDENYRKATRGED